LWLAIRQYLTRMQQLDPQVGWAMAERLAADLTARTGAPAPQGVPPAAYLAAVVQERQAREARRAFGAPAPQSVPGTYGLAAGPPVGAVAPPAAHSAWTAPAGGGESAPPAGSEGEYRIGGTEIPVQSDQQPTPPRETPVVDRPRTGFAPPS